MLITIEKFIRYYCVRKKDQVLNPPIHDMKDFVLPKNSHLHFLQKDGDEIGILATNPLLNYMEKGKVVSEFVVGYADDKAGGFKVVTKDRKEPIRDYFKRNKAIVNGLHSKSAVLLDKNLVVSNYGLMELGVTYFVNQYAWWKEFQNKWNSIFKEIATAVEGNRRNHFVIIDIPSLFPAIAQLKRFEIEASNENVRKIANSQRMIIAQFWNWFNPKALSVVPRGKKIHERLHFIFRFHDKWICANFNMLGDLVKTDSNVRGSYTEIQMKKRFLVMLMTMVFGSVDDIVLDDDDEDNDPIPEEKPKEDEKPNVVVDDEGEEIVQRRETIDATIMVNASDEGTAPIEDVKEAIKESVAKALDKTADLDEVEEEERKKDRKVDKLLDSLDNVNIDVVDSSEDVSKPTQKLVKTDDGKEINAEVSDIPSIDRDQVIVDYKPYVPTVKTHEEKYQEKLKSQVLKGSITPQQMKRLEKMATNYKVIPDPMGSGTTLEKAAFIDKKDVVMTKEKKIVEKVNMVSDESMLSSTLVDFDKKYINEVMNKDIMNAVMSVQNRGLAIQNYTTKRVNRLGDDYYVHSVKIVPIEGEPSTVTFKVPVCDDFGVFESRGIKMRMKKQRVDNNYSLIM